MNEKPFSFSPDFKFGVSTASTQIEGNNQNNNWYRFSTSKTDNIADNTTCDIANLHYERFKEDIELMAKMGIKYYRMSLEWSRIEPDDSLFKEDEIKHYIEEIKCLKEHGIEPLVTLHHFSNPLWFEKKGGMLGKYAVRDFLRFVDYVVCKLNDYIDNWCTINEPNIYSSNIYLFGAWMNNKGGSPIKTIKSISRFIEMHCKAYKIIKTYNPNAQVTFALNCCYFQPINKKDEKIAKLVSGMFQDKVMQCLVKGGSCFPYKSHVKKGDYCDSIGINYYTRNYVDGFSLKAKLDGLPITDFGWDIYPEGLRYFATKYHDLYNKDIYITENGVADDDDDMRGKFLYDYLYQIYDLSYVKGYYHWTFIDNWEWAAGHTMKFGLVALDLKTQVRTIRESGHMYSELIANHGFTEDMINKYVNKEEKSTPKKKTTTKKTTKKVTK